jgi:hypothetical protein
MGTDCVFATGTKMLDRDFEMRAPPPFAGRHCSVPDALPPELFTLLRADILGLAERDRTCIPTHKKGATIGYDVLRSIAPRVTALYHDAVYQNYLSRIVGVPLCPTPFSDNSSLSVLLYDRPGDHIGWHFDHNFYRGRHFTVLIGIENTNHDGTALSAARLLVKKRGGGQIELQTPPNMLILFEGANTLHKVTPLREGERRVILSMTYCTDPTNSRVQEVARKIKDTAFFGVRALWN